jgi:hypothetical protein
MIRSAFRSQIWPVNSLGTHDAHLPTIAANLLPVRLGDTLQLVLLLDGVRIAAALGGVDQLLSKALGDALDVAESGLAGTDGQKGNGLVDAAKGRYIDGLSSDGTGGADTGAVFAGTAVDNGINGDLDGVLVGHDVDLCLVNFPVCLLCASDDVRSRRSEQQCG